jgi:hypothetical protein
MPAVRRTRLAQIQREPQGRWGESRPFVTYALHDQHVISALSFDAPCTQ